MGDLTLRGLDDSVLHALAEEGESVGVSAEDAAKERLLRSFGSSRGARARSVRALQLSRAEGDSVALIREDRDSR